MVNTIAQPLSNIDQINISIGISGTIESYKLYIKPTSNGDILAGFDGSLSGLLAHNKILNESESALVAC